MTTHLPYRDALHRFAQLGSAVGVQLVRITEVTEGNQYKASPIAFNADGQAAVVDGKELTVINLAEPADSAGTLPAGTDAVAIDVESRWVIFVRQSALGTIAKIVASLGGARYTVREQVMVEQGQFNDKPHADDIAAVNLAEVSLGPGAAVDIGVVVLVMAIQQAANPPSLAYVFDHPAYAKYLD